MNESSAYYALVTGASSGIGLMYAQALAQQHHNLLIVSNQEQELAQVAKDLHMQYDITVRAHYCDLAAVDAAQALYDYCRDNALQIDILINNAGVFFFNELVKTDPKRINTMLYLHVYTLTQLCRLFGADMKERGHGYILNMSSISAWMAMPGISIYNATKAYILNFSRSFWYEMKPHGVTVTAVCPGAVDTGLYNLSPQRRQLAVRIGVSMPPEKLVRIALRRMFRGHKQAIPGWINRPFRFCIKHLPDWMVFAAMKRLKQFQK